MTGTRIDAVQLPCPDPARTARFYVEAFGCETEAGEDGTVLVRLGEQHLELSLATVPGIGLTRSNSTGFQHCAMIVSDMREAMAHLEAVHGWTAISRHGPKRLPEASGGVTAFKFRDPDGHPLEFLRFPPDAVPAVWPSDRHGPFLGIDHSAITVSDTDRAIAFWSGLGFRVANRHVNRGVEQARLDGIDANDAVVEVTTLMPDGGAPMHLELLCYQNPLTIARAAPYGSPLATVLSLSGERTERGSDPDGHRFSFRTG